MKLVTGRQMLVNSLRSIYCVTLSRAETQQRECVFILARELTYVCVCVFLEGRAACTHINILQAMGVILGIFIFAGNTKRQPTSNLAFSYFL